MKAWVSLLALLFVTSTLSGCALLARGPDAAASDGPTGPRPAPRPASLETAARPLPAAPRTAEDYDTTTAAERAAASAAPAPQPAQALGTTIAALGDPTEGGFWLKTPLVTATAPGRVVYPPTGATVQLELRPLSGPASAGSQLSLAAMRLLGTPLTELPEVTVYAD